MESLGEMHYPVVAPEAVCTIDAKYLRRAACRGELRSTIRYSANFPCDNWSRDANGGEFICAGLQRFLFCGDGRDACLYTEDVLLSNERLERSSPVLWPDSATLCEYCFSKW